MSTIEPGVNLVLSYLDVSKLTIIASSNKTSKVLIKLLAIGPGIFIALIKLNICRLIHLQAPAPYNKNQLYQFRFAL